MEGDQTGSPPHRAGVRLLPQFSSLVLVPYQFLPSAGSACAAHSLLNYLLSTNLGSAVLAALLPPAVPGFMLPTTAASTAAFRCYHGKTLQT
jgi:hypothetical protein